MNPERNLKSNWTSTTPSHHFLMSSCLDVVLHWELVHVMKASVAWKLFWCHVSLLDKRVIILEYEEKSLLIRPFNNQWSVKLWLMSLWHPAAAGCIHPKREMSIHCRRLIDMWVLLVGWAPHKKIWSEIIITTDFHFTSEKCKARQSNECAKQSCDVFVHNGAWYFVRQFV